MSIRLARAAEAYQAVLSGAPERVVLDPGRCRPRHARHPSWDLPPTYESPGHDPMRMLRLQDASLVPPTSSGSDFPTRFRIAERREHWSDNACPLIHPPLSLSSAGSPGGVGACQTAS